MTMFGDSNKQLIEDLFLLQRVGQKVNSNLNLDSLLEEIVNDVSVTFGCSRLAVLLKDDETNELVVGADCGGDTNRHLKGERLKIGEYGMTGHVGATGQTYYAPDVSMDPYYRVSDSATRSEVDIPLNSNGRLIGVLNAQHKELNGFSSERIKILEGLAGHIATAIENARMFEKERKEKERMAKELVEAQNIQLSLFPARSPAVAGFVVEGTCVPCLEVGGDWYDYIPLPDGQLGVVLADVSGKGMGAAMLMSSTRSTLRLVAENGESPSKVMTRVNTLLLKDFPAMKFVTMLYAIINPHDRTVVFASAGHCYPILVDSDGSHFLRTDVGLPLGIKDVSFSERTVHLGSHHRFVMYTDGVSEARNSVFEQYGEGRLAAFFENPSATVEGLVNDVRHFRGNSPKTDDLTLVLVEAN